MNLSHRPRPAPSLADWLLAGVAVAAVGVESRLKLGLFSPWLPVFALPIGAVLLLRRWYPLLVLGLTTALVLAAMPVLTCYHAGLAVEMLAAATAAAIGRRHSLLIAAAVVPVVTLAYWLSHRDEGAADFAFYALLLFVAVAGGDAWRSRRLAQRSRAREQAAEREMAAQEMFVQLRNELSRELHDSLGHSLVAIATRASVAAHVARQPADPELLSALQDVASVSAEALDELRATLRTLEQRRAPADDVDFESLIRPLRTAGITVSLQIGEGLQNVSRSHLHAAYRILQESLTNVLRHSQATSADISLERSSGALMISVTNDGVRPALRQAGHGIRNMQVRAEELGGTVEAGASDSGRWQVQAWLPEAS